MLPGQGAQEERREAPTSEKARGKECAVGASPPPEMDKAMAWHLQQVGAGGGAGTEGAGCCHLGSGEGGRWPANMGPSGGLRGALLGGWAKPAAHGCGGLATSSGRNLATATNLTTRPCPPVPFDAHGWPFGRRGRCSVLAAHGCPCSYSASCRGVPVGGPGKRPEVPGPWWASAGGGRGEGGVAGSPPRPHQLGLALALPAPTLPPPKSPLHRRGGHLAPGLGCQEEVLGPP